MLSLFDWINVLGATVIIASLVFAGFLLTRGQTTAAGFFGIVTAAVIASIALANLPRISSIAVKAGVTTSIDVKLQEVRENVTEARQIKDQIETLAKRMEEGEQRVARMRDGIQSAYRILFESLAFVVATRHQFPPAVTAQQEIERYMKVLGEVAYPDPEERRAVIARINQQTKK